MKLLENVSSKKKWFVFFITYCGIIVWMTLLNRPVATRQYELRPFWAIQEIVSGNPEGFEDATLYLKNILLFVPFGFFLTVLFEGEGKKVLMCGFTASVLIELTQYITAVGLAELDDLTANIIGAGFGVLLWKVGKKMMDNHQKTLRE